jgi:phosphopentomutase
VSDEPEAVATGPRVPRVCLIVCDSWGVGGAPDAAAYGDEGSNTLAHVATAVGGLWAPNLAALGLGSLTEIDGVAAGGAQQGSAFGSATEISAGKDTTTGHWEMMGIHVTEPFPLYPDGFPSDVVDAFEAAIGREILGNRPASGTEILDELGAEHMATGRPIVYTSGDSVFQIACHEGVVPLATLYEWCRVARRLLREPHAVGRVIARPFIGELGGFSRTAGRRDFSVPPPTETVLERLAGSGVRVYAVGKIQDIFSGQGVTEARYSDSNDHGVALTLDYLKRPGPAFVFANLVDFDSKFGHRNDPRGYAAAIEAFDAQLPSLIEALDGGVLFITGDQGCDPTTPPTDHSRERTPILAAGLSGGPFEIGTRASFGDLGRTIAEFLGVDTDGVLGTSFASRLGRHSSRGQGEVDS